MIIMIIKKTFLPPPLLHRVHKHEVPNMKVFAKVCEIEGRFLKKKELKREGDVRKRRVHKFELAWGR